jgi:hypothetical protein
MLADRAATGTKVPNATTVRRKARRHRLFIVIFLDIDAF